MNRQVNGSISETWIDHVNFAWHLNISHGTCLDVLNPTLKVHRVQWERNLSKDLICDVEQCIVFSFLSLKNVVFKYSQFCLCFHSDGVLEWTGNALPSFRGCHTGRRIGSSSSGEATRFRVSRKKNDVNGATVHRTGRFRRDWRGLALSLHPPLESLAGRSTSRRRRVGRE